LLSGNQVVVVISIALVSAVSGWISMFISLRKNDRSLFKIVANGVMVRLVAVGLIVFAVAILALTNTLKAEVSTLLSGIAGPNDQIQWTPSTLNFLDAIRRKNAFIPFDTLAA
jgi:hypothetical protein